MKITSKELRQKWLDFYESKGHVNIGAVSLIGDGSTGVMFNVAGMQPLMPYLLGAPHPSGKTRLCNVQGCVRTVDIESVGDASHFTFFEMMGNWSLGDYFKQEKTAWTYELLTKVFGLEGEKLCSTVFEGNDAAPRDNETAALLKGLGFTDERIFFLPKADNWWELEGTVGTPCGPDNEWFYPIHGGDAPVFPQDYVEIGNDVYMQYRKTETGYAPLENKNVDTGFGLDRMLLFLNGLTDGYKTDLFAGAIAKLEQLTGKRYDEDPAAQKAMRIVADHTRTTVMLIGDVNGILPSNTGAGYILRRLMRRAIRYCRQLGVEPASAMQQVAAVFIDEVYGEAYPLLQEKRAYILDEIKKEADRFETMLEKGMAEFEKCVNGIARKNAFMAQSNPDYQPETLIGGKQAFRLYDTYGFPLELTEEMAAERGLTVDKAGFDAAFKEHQEKSRGDVHAGEAKGGLESHSQQATRYHTATHLLNAALKQVLSPDVNQKGSNITDERMRFDFNFARPMTAEEVQAVEALVNEKIRENIPVVYKEMSLEEARAQHFVGVFDSKYGDVVKTYSIGEFSKEMCGGPHVAATGELGTFKIVKEQSSSAGVRRIKAILK